MEEWVPLDPQFPGYQISSYGQVMNPRGHCLAQSKNNTGYMKVGMKDHTGTRRTVEVTRLVAITFVPGQDSQNDTPIHLDGNREHTFASNLMWRPRWFAAKFHQQFRDRSCYTQVPIVELKTGQVFADSHQAITTLGILERDVMLSHVNHSTIFPGGYTFRIHQQ